MTKREMIDEILLLNKSAGAEFLSQFEVIELEEYLSHLQMINTPRLSCVHGQYDRYFENLPAVASGKSNPKATIVDPASAEAGVWPQDKMLEDEDQVPVEQLLFDELDDDLEDVGDEHLNVLQYNQMQQSVGHSQR